ncbi:hypothetical protein GALMADRAFT_144516 [Galerina marginata CBS 339.88]|uniref:Uncharacterized protein n=1 Tax=Galerina marginata (strain CBS 339.88) TaxID=685588 RepID=A0A067SV17_GALM3|nr:hypothetical protein GALMADRAFT_144516 [Galerina marginata CBS 339.88]
MAGFRTITLGLKHSSYSPGSMAQTPNVQPAPSGPYQSNAHLSRQIVQAPIPTSLLVAGPSSHVNINMDKFKVISSIYLMPLINTWAKALTTVDTNSALIKVHAEQDLLHGYHTMDPQLLVNTTNRRTLYLVCWLVLRKAWLMCTTRRDETDRTLPNPNNWKQFLTDRVAVSLGM